MVTKSDNIKGNPYHSSEDGKFTSKDNQESLSSVSRSEIVFNDEDFDINDFSDLFNDEDFNLDDFADIIEEEDPSMKVFGRKGVIQFDKSTPDDIKKQYIDALFKVSSDFPKIFMNNENIIVYGTDYKSIDQDFIEKKRVEYAQYINNLLDSGVFDRSFEKIKNAQYGVDDVEGIPYEKYESTVAENLKTKIKSLFSNYLDNYKEYTNYWKKEFKTKERKYFSSTTLGLHGDFPVVYTKTIRKEVNDLWKKGKRGLSNALQTAYNNIYMATKPISGTFIMFNKDQTEFTPSVFDKTKKIYKQFGTGVHELGHFIDNQMQKYLNSDEKRQLRDLTSQRMKMYVDKQTSDYATTNADECIAEAFNDYYAGSNTSDFNKSIVELFKSVYKRIGG